MIDTHCHLNMAVFETDLPAVITRAKKAGVEKIIVPGVDFYSSKKALELSEKYPGYLYASVGFHPYEAQHIQDIRPIMKMTGSAIAIGEIGLDYHIYKGERAEGKKSAQKLLFDAHLRLALKHNLPVIIHCREAFDDLFDVIDSLPKLPRGVIHCFSGGLQDIRSAAKRNLYMGIDGNVTYSKHLQTMITKIPTSLLLIETDSPNLTPAPHRGERNEPKHLRHIVSEIAKILKLNTNDIVKTTTDNAASLFHFK